MLPIIDQVYQDPLKEEEHDADDDHGDQYGCGNNGSACEQLDHKRHQRGVQENPHHTVVVEDRPAELFSLDADKHIHKHGDDHEEYADPDGEDQEPDDGIHHLKRLSGHSKGRIQRIQELLIAKERAVHKPTDRGGDPAGNQDLPERHLFQLPHQIAEDCQNNPLPHIAEHDAEQDRVRDRDEAGRVKLIIGRKAVHLNVELKRTEKGVVLEQNRRLCRRLDVRIADLIGGALDLLGLGLKALRLLGRHPARKEKVVVLDGRIFAQVIDQL